MLTAERLLPLSAAARAASSLARLVWLNPSEPLSATAEADALLAGALLAGALLDAGALLAGALLVAAGADVELELEQAAASDSAATAGMAASALRLILIDVCPSCRFGGDSLCCIALTDDRRQGPSRRCP
jgi:hypothetical protein